MNSKTVLPSFSNIPKKRKIIWISPLIIDSSLHAHAQIEILEHLAKRGNGVCLFALRSNKKFHLTNSNVKSILIPMIYLPIITSILFAVILSFFLPFYVAIKKPNVIVTGLGPSIFAFMWKPILFPYNHIKIVLDIRSTVVEVNNFRKHLDALFFNISVKIAKRIFDGITIITSQMKRELCVKFHINPKFIGVWTSGVSLRLFKPERYNGLEVKKALGLTNKFVILYHGNFSNKRGIIETVKSIEKVGNECHNVVLFLLGDGPALPFLEELIDKKALHNNLIIHHTVDYIEVPKYIAMCDIGIVPLPNLPDWRHQCPLKLLEYLAMRKVVIVTDILANREVVGNSKCGIYVSSSTPNEIAKAIVYAYNNQAMLKEWGSYGRAIISEKYSWERVAEDLHNYLFRTMGKR